MSVGAFRVGQTNASGLTWPEWFRLTGRESYSVACNRSPVLTEHEELFEAWEANEDPKEFQLTET